jgi:hypothetical protein
MNAPSSSTRGMRRSHQVALVLLGTAGVVGAGTMFYAWRESAHEPTTVPQTPPTPLAEDRVYTNNEYIPGVGYYHAPYHAWFPHPYNYHDPSRGYFAGGLWQAVPWMLALSQSSPTNTAVSSALAARRQYDEQQAQQARQNRSWFGGGSSSSGYRSGSFSRGTSTPASRPSPGIFRGGFGSSSHPAGS